MSHVDGNAIAGLLTEVFDRDMTLATGECSGCGDEGPLARAMVFLHAPSVVVRCGRCGEVLFTIATSEGTPRLHVSGLGALRFG